MTTWTEDTNQERTRTTTGLKKGIATKETTRTRETTEIMTEVSNRANIKKKTTDRIIMINPMTTMRIDMREEEMGIINKY